MITTQEIMDVALCFAGRTLTQGEESALSSLCQGAYTLWESRLRDGLEPEDCREIFLMACAWTALGSFSAAVQSGDPVSFSVGDLSVTQGGAGDAAGRSLQAQAEKLMLPYTADASFAFLEVMG